MKRLALAVLVLTSVPLLAQNKGAAPPQLAFKVVDDFFQIPDTIWMAEAVGVALNAKGHIFILNRGNHPLLEFTPDGKFVRSLGEGSPIFHAAHSVRFDAQDNMWVVDSGNDVIVKVTPKGRIEQALGRRREPWVWDTHGIERAIPAPPSFYQPTDTVVGPDGSTYVTDGYGNSRVVKFSKQGNYVKHWGYRGTGPGLFNTPHSIVMDARGQNLYVADRANSRVQVFDTEGTFKTEWRLSEASGGETGRSSEPWSLCITPGPNQVIYAGSVGRVFKLDLNGKVLGTFGKLGRLPGWFDSIHAIACPDEKTIFLAQEFSYRFDKVVLE
jgi:DNA-binding beta-propeller fold protein YncE